MEIIFSHNKIPQADSEWLSCVAIEDSIIMGVCDLGWRWDHSCISSLHVSEDARRIGVATAMIKACVLKSAEGGKKAVYLTVSRTNDAAIALYRKNGFKSFLDDKENIWFGLPLNQ